MLTFDVPENIEESWDIDLKASILQRLQRRADTQPQAAYVHALLASARLTAQTGRVGFARLPKDWLTHASSADVTAGTWIGLEQHGQAGLSPAQAEKLLKKDKPRIWKKLEDVISQSEGKPTADLSTCGKTPLVVKIVEPTDFPNLDGDLDDDDDLLN